MNIKALIVPLAATAAWLAMYGITTAAAAAQVEVTVNGSAVDIQPAPIVQAGRVFVPLRGVFEQLGASVVYSNGTINATGNGRDITLQIGSTQATVNNQPQTIDVAPFIVGDSTYVPLRFISEALGDSVRWDDANSVAAIDTGGGPADYYAPGTASYVDTPPPPIPVYEQPYVPEPNYIWQPGYWAWGSYGYYWVPGTWVAAPQPGYLWTPGYWQYNDAGYNWNPGYWAIAVGFYGGVNYGSGYFGNGYDGGEWHNREFRYNTYVTRVNTTNIRNVYVNRYVYINNSPTRISYNGGRRGLQARPTSQQVAVAKGRHLGMTDVQRQHLAVAEGDRRLLATVNRDKPPVLAVPRPLNANNRPAGFVPVKPADRVNPLANVAPRRTIPAAGRIAPPAGHAAPPPRASEAHVAPAAPPVHAPAAHGVPPPAPAVHVAPPAPAAHVAPAPRAPAVHVAPPVPAPVVHAAPPAPAPAFHAVPAPAVHAAAPVHVQPVYAAPPPRAPAVHAPPAPAVHAPPAPTVHAPPAPAVHAPPAPAVHAPPAPTVHAPAAPAVHAPPAPAHAAPPNQSPPKEQKPPGR